MDMSDTLPVDGMFDDIPDLDEEDLSLVMCPMRKVM